MVTAGTLHGHRILYLENDHLRVGILPEKGADICEFTYKPQMVDFLMKTPAGLRPPGDTPASGFLDNYEGGWQELFPNANDACEISGASIPFHGEVALYPWDVVVERDDPQESRLRMTVICKAIPFRLERRMRLRAGEARLEIEETAFNPSEDSQYFVWGHHVVLGGDFLEDGCRLDVPAGLITTPDVIYEPETAALAHSQHEPWPTALARDKNSRIDLRHIPGPQARTHDDACIGELRDGWLSVTNPRLRLAFRLTWDANLFRWIMLWMPYGGAVMSPLTGIYGLGIEPWVSRFNLAGAVEHDQARLLGPHESVNTRLAAEILPVR